MAGRLVISTVRSIPLALIVALSACKSSDRKATAREVDEPAASAHAAAASARFGGVLKGLRPRHPRLLLTPASLADLKKKIAADPLAKAWSAAIAAEGAKLLEEKNLGVSFPAAGNKGRVVADRLYLLGMLYRLAPDRAAAEKWARRADEELLAVSKMTWSESSFLQLAEFANGVAVGYDWTYDALSPATRAAVVRALHEKAVLPATLAYRKESTGSIQSWWRDSSSNWNLVSNSGVVLAALAIAGDDEDAKHLADIEDVLERALVSLDKGLPSSVSYGLAGYGSDGAWAEGPDYWNYATRYLVTMLEALDTALGKDFGVWHSKRGLEATGFFPKYFTGPIGLTFNYADCNESGDENGAEASPFLFRLAHHYDQPLFADIEERHLRDEDARHHLADRPYNLVLDLLWMEAPRTAAEPPLDARFQDQGLAFLRQSFGDPRALSLAIKGGVAFGPHHHADLGSFVLDADGVRWVIDLGKDNYSLKDYGHHDKTFWYRQKTEGHNTLVFDGQNQEESASSIAPIQKWTVNRAEALSFGSIDLSRPYASHAARVTRGFALDRSRRLVLLRDEFEPRKGGGHAKKLKWTIHTRGDVTIESGGKVALLSEARASATAKMKLVLLEPRGARFESGPAPAAEGLEESRAGIRVVSITVDASRAAEVVVAFVPESSPDFRLDEPALAKSIARASPSFFEAIAKWP